MLFVKKKAWWRITASTAYESVYNKLHKTRFVFCMSPLFMAHLDRNLQWNHKSISFYWTVLCDLLQVRAFTPLYLLGWFYCVFLLICYLIFNFLFHLLSIFYISIVSHMSAWHYKNIAKNFHASVQRSSYRLAFPLSLTNSSICTVFHTHHATNKSTLYFTQAFLKLSLSRPISFHQPISQAVTITYLHSPLK